MIVAQYINLPVNIPLYGISPCRVQRVNYIPKGPIREENLTLPVDDKNGRFSPSHYFRILNNKKTRKAFPSDFC